MIASTSSSPRRATTRTPTTRCSRPWRAREPLVLMTTPEAEDGATAIFGGGEGLEARARWRPAPCCGRDRRRACAGWRQAEDGLETVSILAAGDEARAPGQRRRCASRGSTSRARPARSRTSASPTSRAASSSRQPVRGKVVVIGVNGETRHTIGDTYDTPAGTGMAGPEIQRRAIATALAASRCATRPPGRSGWRSSCSPLIPPLVALRWGPFVALFAGLVAAALYLVSPSSRSTAAGSSSSSRRSRPCSRAWSATASLVHAATARPGWTACWTRQRRARRQPAHAPAAGAAAADRRVRRRGHPARSSRPRARSSASSCRTVDARFSVRGDQEPPPDVVLVAHRRQDVRAARCAVAVPAALSRQGHRPR